jgi:two-component system, cell cycle sensor histidine kinase and response regulator CckA
MGTPSITATSDSSPGRPLLTGMLKIEHREWWLWSSAILIILLLTLGLTSYVFPLLQQEDLNSLLLNHPVRGLLGLVLLFDVYVIYQQLQIFRMRRELLQREELFRLITENAADMIAVVDSEGKRLYNSPSYERVLGYTRQELKEMSPYDWIHPEDQARVKDAARELQQTGAGHRIEYRMRHKDGTWRILESTGSVISGPHGRSGNLVTVNRDVTARRKLEEQFRQVLKMEAVGRLSGGIAHDFNNILGVIIGYSELLRERLDAKDPLVSCVDEILAAGRRGASLIRQLLAFSRQQVLEPKIIDLNAIVSDTEKMLRRLIGEDIELETVLDPTPAKIKADQTQIEQVLLNLSVNARDAMPNGGKLTIRTENAEMSEADIRRYSYPVKPGRYMLLTVSDNGIGMNAETQARVFEPFFTTKEKGKGTGMGLATVYGIVKQSDGYIEVHSEVGSGTTFKIFLPQASGIPEPDQSERKLPVAYSEQGHETILVVEDESALRKLTVNVLPTLGYTVLAAANGKEAIELSEQYPETIHLLLTDVIMPGMNGRALAEHLAITRPHMQVLYMSGHTGQGVGQGVLAPGSNFIPKPFTREKLADKIRQLLRSGSPSHTAENSGGTREETTAS